MAEFVYQMIKARKAYGDRVILDDVTLSFLPGAKIGVVGPNGMGKSTLLKIMAGLETVSNGEAYITPGFTVGILQQEPPLDDTKTVGENIKICEVDRGHLYPYKGNYSTYLETKAKRLEIQGAKDAKLAKRLKNELEWVRSSPKARQAKNKARLERYDQMENEARNNKKLDFSEIQIPAGPRLGSVVLEAEHLHKAFGDRVLIDDLSFTLPRNGIVGVIGPNGVGKSTLFKTIVGLEPLTSGELKIGDTVKISYVDQNREGLDPNKNLWEAVSGGLDFIEVAGVEVPTRAYVASFGFKGSDQQKLTGVLSGGERNRLNLALTLKQGGNLLLLDEPTNDLDVETLESLENALLGFPGCAVVISHDRWFLDRIATHILAWEGDDENPAKWYWFEGNFQAYQENRVARLGEDAARPHRLHKKLTRV